MASAKIIIVGNSGAGKTEFIQTLTRKNNLEDQPITSESRRSRAEGKEAAKGQKRASESLDIDRIVVRDDLILHLYGVPGERNLSFLWHALAKDALGYVILVDASRPEVLLDTKEILKLIKSFRQVPYLIAVTKMDLAKNIQLEEIKNRLQLEPDISVHACDARVKNSVKDVVISLLEKVKE